MSLKDTDVRTPGDDDIAKKFKLSLARVRQLVADGAKHEKEHNTNQKKAEEVARDHISERPDYYKMLRKAEKTKVQVKEESSTAGVRGLGYISGDPAGMSYVDQYINTNAMAYEDENGNKLENIKNNHKKYHKLSFNDFDPKNIKAAKNFMNEGISAGPERSSDYSVGDIGGGRTLMHPLDVKEGKVLDKIKKSAKVGALVGALGAHGGKIYDIGNVATHHDDPGLAAATMVANIHPASRVANAMTTALKASKANAGENEFDRQKKYGNKVVTKEEQIKEDLRKWFREKWVRYDTKGNIKGPCAREEGEGKPKCRPLASARAMSKDERAKSARRKRREDPVADRPGKGGKPIMVNTNEETLLEKNVPTNPELWARAKAQAKAKFDVYPSAYANGWASKWYKSKGGGWKSSANESVDEACWSGYQAKGMKKKGNKMVPNCVPVEEQGQVYSRYTERPMYEKNKDTFSSTESERGIYEMIDQEAHDKRIKKLRTGVLEDWQSVNRKDKTDGLSQAAVNAYRREHPGSKLKTAVTEKNPTGKRASRRKSFCSRMGGMKKRLTSAKTARDPDSRINKALRRWNCEESVVNEISAELVGKVSNARWRRGEAPSKTLTRAINKKFIESGKKKEPKKEVKEQQHLHLNKPDTRYAPGATGTTHTVYEETKMDNKNLINEAIENILENDLSAMKENLMASLQEKAMEKLEERKKQIASDYFAQ